MIYHRLCN